MEPLLALVAQWWWIAPVGAGAGAAGWLSATFHRERRRRPRPPKPLPIAAARRLELQASLHELRHSKDAASRVRAEARIAHAEAARELAASGRTSQASAMARARVQHAQRMARAAEAEVRAHRAGVRAARVTLPAVRAGRAPLPVDRVLAEHDLLMRRWLVYETDAELQLTYPSMSDPSSPMLGAFLREYAVARDLRPADARTRLTAGEFAAYRTAVRRSTQAFDAAEASARGIPSSGVGAGTEAWTQIAADVVEGTGRAVAWSVEAVGRATRGRFPR